MANKIMKKDKKIGFARAAAWDTAEEPGAGEALRLTGLTLPSGGRETDDNGDVAGQGMKTFITPLSYTAQDGSMEGKLYFEGCEPLFAAFFGDEDTPEEVVAGAYRKTYRLAEVIENLQYTLGADEGSEVKCIPSLVVKSLNIKNDKVMKLTAGFLGNKVVKPSGWTTPIAATPESDIEIPARLIDTHVFINAFSGADFAAGDEVHVTNLNIDLTRGYQAPDVESGKDSIGYPDEMEVPSGAITLEFAKKDAVNAAYFADFDAMSEKKMKIVMTATALIGATAVPFSITLYVPRAMFQEPPTYEFDSPTKTTAKLEMLKAVAAPTAMDDIRPYIEVVNSLNKTYLS